MSMTAHEGSLQQTRVLTWWFRIPLTAPRVLPLAGTARLGHSVLLIALLMLPLAVIGLYGWPRYLVVPLLLYAALAINFTPLRRTIPRIAVGHIRTHDLSDGLGLAVACSALMLLSYLLFRIDFSFFRRQVPHWPEPKLIAACLGLALANAFLEELVWRGIVYDSLAVFGVGPALTLSSMAFAISHVFFLPTPILGMSMALTFGLAAGWIRARTGGIALPILMHFLVDSTLAAIIISPVPFAR